MTGRQRIELYRDGFNHGCDAVSHHALIWGMGAGFIAGLAIVLTVWALS